MNHVQTSSKYDGTCITWHARTRLTSMSPSESSDDMAARNDKIDSNFALGAWLTAETITSHDYSSVCDWMRCTWCGARAGWKLRESSVAVHHTSTVAPLATVLSSSAGKRYVHAAPSWPSPSRSAGWKRFPSMETCDFEECIFKISTYTNLDAGHNAPNIRCLHVDKHTAIALQLCRRDVA